ncbi:MAG TPA: lipoyl(octanoyl) transferase LipB [Polyangia bacterium]|nr:lipoyl(octanoyl) transferase LipB [Polyangia bacterium]
MTAFSGFEVRVLPGLVPYAEALTLQHDLVERRQAGRSSDTLLLLEHPPVITLGRNALESGVLASPAALEALGVEVHRIERGGQATWHGPGQIVGYPICDLHGLGLGVAKWVRALEEVMIRAAAALGVAAERRPGITGVFSERGKLGALGVRISRGISFHGFAFNVDPDLSHYRLIVPCGMAEMPMTSVAAALGHAPPMDAARRAVIDAFLEVVAGR